MPEHCEQSEKSGQDCWAARYIVAVAAHLTNGKSETNLSRRAPRRTTIPSIASILPNGKSETSLRFQKKTIVLRSSTTFPG